MSSLGTRLVRNRARVLEEHRERVGDSRQVPLEAWEIAEHVQHLRPCIHKEQAHMASAGDHCSRTLRWPAKNSTSDPDQKPHNFEHLSSDACQHACVVEPRATRGAMTAAVSGSDRILSRIESPVSYRHRSRRHCQLFRAAYSQSSCSACHSEPTLHFQR